MKKLNVALIGQGRSGKDIHGNFFLSDANKLYNVKYVIDRDPVRRDIAKGLFPEAEVVAECTELFDRKDIDLFVVSTYSNEHYPVAKSILEHGYNALVEKPMARTAEECQDLIDTAKRKGVKVAVFQQSLYAPYFNHLQEVIKSGVLGRLSEIKLRWNGFARRWDWQTLQKMAAGNAYNTGPHPIGIGLHLIDYDKDWRVAYSKLETTCNSSGDSDDFTKIIIEAPNKPMIDMEMHSNCFWSPYNVQLVGDHGNYQTNIFGYKLKYYLDEENPKKELVQGSLMDEKHTPKYCSEQMVWHEEEKNYEGTAFEVGTANLYEDLYHYLTEDRPMKVQAWMGREVIRVCEKIHEDNPLPVKIKY
ncbi:MAG: Gfo/Idh/MocA family oxidoreductase [Bacilli bacterium]|nr:Gfo/Idh/MocA family oxidoreductase [Bacilli bacterium]